MDNCFQPVSPAAWQNQHRTFSPGDKKKLSLFLANVKGKIDAYTLTFCTFLTWRRQASLEKEQQDRLILQEGGF
ncbi:hypothetical protein JGY68_002821 [Salmonella enterica]|uniref:hypothetical protein n=1 Tax=Salmonella enterica TaxID=28901 RepID=UPI0015D00D1B|nr:hypothetical protein [Salmonella enterica]EHJ5090014.1 hypothetical protein [Salmonella enterica subsp. salamae serovar 16:m,t:-]EGH5311350.1 hypothetical protein [Salmonella enterica]EGW8386053.1 hypothetical protein [Salmonella enterica]EHJ6520287.1 hypothetical protein [Salmonella enterica subsp. salamae serovar 16:m,t:-]EHJ8951206.1 hypothetical protein [Salmonella enterica]